MAPSNPTLSEGRNGCGSGEYRRRAHPHCSHGHGKPSDAVAAAEAAASYILSDGPIRSKKSFARNRSGSGGGNANGGNANGGNVGSGNGPNSNGGGPNNSGDGGRSFLLRMHNQRERLMQRQKNRDFLTPLKTTAWILLFALVGAIFMYEGEQLHRERRGLRQNGGDGALNGHDVVSVPLPPNIERKNKERESVVQSIGGAHHNWNQDDVEKRGENPPAKRDAESREVEDDDAPRKRSARKKNRGGDVLGEQSTESKETGDGAKKIPQTSRTELSFERRGHHKKKRADAQDDAKDGAVAQSVRGGHSNNSKQRNDAPGKHSAESKENRKRNQEDAPAAIELKNGKDRQDVVPPDTPGRGGHSKNEKRRDNVPGKQSVESKELGVGTGRTKLESPPGEHHKKNRDVVPPSIEGKNGNDRFADLSGRGGHAKNKTRGDDAPGKQIAESKGAGDDAKSVPKTGRTELESVRQGHHKNNQQSDGQERQSAELEAAQKAKLLQGDANSAQEARHLESGEVGDGAKYAPETRHTELKPVRQEHRKKNQDDVGVSKEHVKNKKQPDDAPRKHSTESKGVGDDEKLESQREGKGHHENHQGGEGVPKERSSESGAARKATLMEGDANSALATSHHHVIPAVLIFTYHTNLITTPESDLKDEEDVALAQNVKQIISYHPGSSVRFLNDEQCLESIRLALGPNTNLTKYFTEEKHGMYKADICRGAALYETGGLYFDIDIEARMPLWEAIAPNTEFVTTLVHKDSNHHGGFFQAFIGVTPQHPIMKRYLELFVEYYEGRVEVKGPLGVYFLRMAYDDVGHDEAVADLWQEVRYHPKLFPDLKRDHWGERRACQMLVVAPERKGNGGEVKRETTVPLFSHANGSRMCGGKDTHRRGGTG